MLTNRRLVVAHTYGSGDIVEIYSVVRINGLSEYVLKSDDENYLYRAALILPGGVVFEVAPLKHKQKAVTKSISKEEQEYRKKLGVRLHDFLVQAFVFLDKATELEGARPSFEERA